MPIGTTAAISLGQRPAGIEVSKRTAQPETYFSSRRRSSSETTRPTEAANMVALFRGHVLKYTGDGLLAFFPGLGPNTQNDLGIDCALSLTTLVADGLNPELERAGLPALRVRLGLDHGQAAVRVLGSPATKRHADLIGEVVNLACKVQGLAAPGGVCIGG